MFGSSTFASAAFGAELKSGPPTIGAVFAAAEAATPDVAAFVGDGSLSGSLGAVESGADAFAARGGLRYLTVTLTTDGTNPAASLTGLSYAVFDEVTPGAFTQPVNAGSGLTTDASGVAKVPAWGTSKTTGGVVWLIVSNSDGSTSQAPPAKAFSGPVTL